MKFGLDSDTVEQIHSVFKKYPEIEEGILYGSRAKGNYREGSDIDITLKGKAITEQIRSDVWLDLDDLMTPYLFDISDFKTLQSTSLIEHINRIGLMFYKKDEQFLRFRNQSQTS